MRDRVRDLWCVAAAAFVLMTIGGCDRLRPALGLCPEMPTCDRRCAGEPPAAVPSGCSAPLCVCGPLDEAIESLNSCAHGSECLDLGRYCPQTCNALVTQPSGDELDTWSFANGRVAERARTEACPGGCEWPFWGARCIAGRCERRLKEPERSICWAPGGARIDCVEVFRRFAAVAVENQSCERLCGGEAKGRLREFLERLPDPAAPGDGSRHVTVRYIVDYVACADCERLR